MKVTLTEMHSIRDAIRTMYMSKRTWNREIEQQLKEMVDHCTDRYGRPLDLPEDDELKIKFDKEVAKLLKWGQKHITMLRFEDISVIVEGLHRGATDDLDSHAKRMDNRIIRSSTRLADYHEGEVSEWYEDKIITWDEVLKYLGTKIPGEISYYGDTYVRSNNGFIKKGLENNKDVKRGLYPLAIPMNFTFKINITELAHIYVERGSKDGGAHGTAAPELQIMIEDLINQIESWYPGINRELLLKIASNNV